MVRTGTRRARTSYRRASRGRAQGDCEAYDSIRQIDSASNEQIVSLKYACHWFE